MSTPIPSLLPLSLKRPRRRSVGAVWTVWIADIDKFHQVSGSLETRHGWRTLRTSGERIDELSTPVVVPDRIVSGKA
jgi:hypothetical protein